MQKFSQALESLKSEIEGKFTEKELEAVGKLKFYIDTRGTRRYGKLYDVSDLTIFDAYMQIQL